MNTITEQNEPGDTRRIVPAADQDGFDGGFLLRDPATGEDRWAATREELEAGGGVVANT